VPQPAKFRIDGVDFLVSECRTDQLDTLDEFLATLPPPPPAEDQLQAMEAAVRRMTNAVFEGIRANTEPDAVEANRAANDLLVRKQLAAEVGRQLEAIREDRGDWPPQVLGGGVRVLMQSRAGKRLLFRCALHTERPDLPPEEADRLYARLRAVEYIRVLNAFLPSAMGGEEDGDPNGGGAESPPATAGTTSMTASPPPTAGPPTSSAG
jgi:hypothetical protein